MNFICQKEIKNIEFYLNFDKPIRIYLQDLNHQAPFLRADAIKKNIKIYGCRGRRSKNDVWVSFTIQGIIAPKTYKITFSNGVQIIDYNGFDTDKDASLEDMYEVATEIEALAGNSNFSTCSSLVRAQYSEFLNGEMAVTEAERPYYYALQKALRGGANYIMPQYLKTNIRREIHIDIHQNYANILLNHKFPFGAITEVDGYFPHEFAIYWIQPGSMARLRRNGFPLIPCGWMGDGMIGEDGNWFDAGNLIQYICDPDFQIFLENYETDENFRIVSTMYFKNSFEGKTEFGDLIYKCYERRKANKGKPAERFYKMLNEIIPGNFQRTTYFGTFWNSEQIINCGFNSDKQVTTYNPKIGIFITAYARKRLNSLLHQVDKTKVIGYDTDAIFFYGNENMLSDTLVSQFGPGIGQLHIDMRLVNSFHQASKSYYGTDEKTEEIIKRQAGVSKKGYKWVWDIETALFVKIENGGNNNEKLR